MALTPEQQAFEQITRAKRILILTKENPSTDALASISAALLFLRAMGKQADAVAPRTSSEELPSFLPQRDDIKPHIGALRTFNITLDLKEVPLGELMYDVVDGALQITVIPKKDEWQPKHLSFKSGENRYDLILALDTPDTQSLGELMRTHADFLLRTPVINIDCSPSNERWGQINLCDIQAVSTTEILFRLFESWNRNLINADIATSLLAGVISKTRSFRTQHVTPKTLTIASQLMAMGARREEIVHGLWRTRSVPTLKLWGRILSRLKQDEDRGIVWSLISRHDVLETGADHTEVHDVTQELIAYAPEATIVVLIMEQTDGGHLVSLQTKGVHAAADLARVFGATGTQDHATFSLPDVTSLNDAAKHVIDRLREIVHPAKK